MVDVEESEVHDENDNPEIHFEPIVKLDPVEVKTLEEDEDCLFKIRARIYRFDNEADPPEWKERGTGDVKLLRHLETLKIRLLMRREKTLKICANHYLLPEMNLRPNCGSNKAFVWATQADMSDNEPKEELLAIRFGNEDNAQKFKASFEKCCIEMGELLKNDEEKKDAHESLREKDGDKDGSVNLVTKTLESLNVEEKGDTHIKNTDTENEIKSGE